MGLEQRGADRRRRFLAARRHAVRPQADGRDADRHGSGDGGSTHRHNYTTLYHAFQGSGATEIEGERYEWTQGDVFVVPPWAWHSHTNRSGDDAILYSINDRPASAALGLHREESQAR